jgi:hypothetical protein
MQIQTVLAKISAEVERGFDTFGSPHLMLRTWRREVWPAGAPGHGRLLRVTVDLPNPFSVDDLAELGGIDRLGLELAEKESRLIFDPSAAKQMTSTSDVLDDAVRRALAQSMGVSHHLGIWMNFADEERIASGSSRPWDGLGDEPAYAYWGTWHRVPVFQTNFVKSGEVWVLGDRSTRLLVYPDQERSGRISVLLDRSRAPQHLEARLWLDLSMRDPRAMHRIAFDARTGT